MSLVRKFLASLVLVSGTAAAWAAPLLPAPQEFYFDPDPAAVPVVVVQAEGDELVSQLLRQRERGRKSLEATVQLAGVAIAQGRTELGQQLYTEALQATAANSPSGRMVRWNHGWDLFRQGQPEAALEQWHAAASALRGNPSWIPPTYALALWELGQKEEAVKWYAAAVRTEPGQWSTSTNYPSLLPTWRDSERATLAQVQQAWAAQPPKWP